MMICICNALNERKVDAALEAGADRVALLYRLNGCAPQCGKCVPEMLRRLKAHREAAASRPLD